MHATLIIAGSLDGAELPVELSTQSADVEHVLMDQFTIDAARRLTERASRQPVSAAQRSFVVCCSSMTLEAQNALLKLFEEPPAPSVFYLIVPHESLLLPTLRSRLMKRFAGSSSVRDTAAADAFLAMSYADRLAAIAAMQKSKDTASMERLARTLATVIAHDVGAYDQVVVAEVAFVESRIGVKGGSKKMLLEHLALSLPMPT